jgi:hypothetical protein
MNMPQPTPQAILLEKIVELNAQIVRQNAAIVQLLTTPLFFVKNPESEK